MASLGQRNGGYASVVQGMTADPEFSIPSAAVGNMTTRRLVKPELLPALEAMPATVITWESLPQVHA